MEHPENVSEIDQNWNLGQITGFATFYPNLPQLTRIIYHDNRDCYHGQPRLWNIVFLTGNLEMNELSLEIDQNANRIWKVVQYRGGWLHETSG